MKLTFGKVELDVVEFIEAGKWVAYHVRQDGKDKYLVVAAKSGEPLALAFTYQGAKVIAAGLNVADIAQEIFGVEFPKSKAEDAGKAFEPLAKNGYDADLIRKDVDEMRKQGKTNDEIAHYLYDNEAKYRVKGKEAW